MGRRTLRPARRQRGAARLPEGRVARGGGNGAADGLRAARLVTLVTWGEAAARLVTIVPSGEASGPSAATAIPACADAAEFAAVTVGRRQ